MKKKSLITLFSLFTVVIVVLLVGVIVLASQTQNLNSNISISYTATEISGGVSATYKIGDGEEKDMIVDGNTSKLVATFDADLNSTTQGLSPTESQLVLLAKQDLIFTYTFFNRGDYPYYATLNYTDSNNDDMNIDVYYKSASDAEFSMDNATQIQVPAMVGEAVGTTTYQVKMTIHDSSFDSKMSGVFNWNLSKEKPLNISLAYTNNTNSAINPENVTIVANEDKTQFKIVGPTPIVADSSTTNLTELTNASGSEFYYFASNSEVKDTTGYTNPGTTYYISPYSAEETTSSMYTYGQGLQNMSATMASDPSQYTASEVWYDMPAKPTIIYATFMTPNNTTGDKSGGASGDIIISHSVLSIPESAFSESQITSCVIPNTVTRIGQMAFYNCSIINAEMPESVTNIERGAFAYCFYLTKVSIPKDVTTINEYAFALCFSLTSITIPDSVTSIGNYAFSGCENLTSITIPDSVTSIGADAFAGCENLNYNILDNVKYLGSINNPYMIVMGVTDTTLTSYTISNRAKSISSNVFSGCTNLTDIIIPESLSFLPPDLFTDCTNLNYNILGNVKYLGNNENPYVVAMGVTDSTLTSYTISNSTKGIYYRAFFECSSLRNITIPDTVTSIGLQAFFGCNNLRSITIGSGVTNIMDEAFYQSNSNLESITVSSANTIYKAEKNCLIDTSTKTLILGCNNSIIPTDGSVTSIGDNAFSGCDGLTSITIPSSVTSIGSNAFSGCDGLTRVNITDIAKWCSISFSGENSNPLHKAHNLYLNDTLVRELVIPNGVTSIGAYAFQYCSSLTSVTIPDSVTSIGYDAFEGSGGLIVNITDIAKWCNISFGNYYSNPSKDGYLYLNNTLVTDLVIPSGVITIGEFAFFGCSSLTSVTIPDSVTSIGDRAFDWCTNLKKIIIPNSVTSIGNSTFSYCYNLVEVYNLSSLNITAGSNTNGYAGRYAKVIHTSLSEESIIKEVDNYQYYAYNGEYGLLGYKGIPTELTLPANLEGNNYIINQYAFYNCTNLTSVTIGSGVTSIGENAFRACSSLTSITIPDSVTSIGVYAFLNCHSLTKVNITDIEKWCNISFGDNDANPLSYAKNLYLNDTLVTDLVIPDGVTSIGNYTFYNYGNLTSITIPDSVTNIGSSAFQYCYNLVEVYNLSNLSITVGSNSNGYAGYYAKVIHTSLSEESIIKEVYDYQYMIYNGVYYLLGYKGTSNEITLPANLEGNNYSIYQHAFSGCSSLTSIIIPESVTSIGRFAFGYCSSLTTVTIGSGVTSIGNDAFYSCNNLKKVNITDIAKWCSISFENSYANPLYYAKNVYLNDTLVTDIVIPSGVTSIGNNAFYNCSSLTSITIPESVTSIGGNAFQGCSSLTSIIIPESVTSIGGNAFQGCSSLTSITIPEGVTNIGNSAFSSCSKLTDVYYDGSEYQWNSIIIGSKNTPLTSATIHYLYGWTFVEVQTEPTCIEDGVKIYEKNGVQKQVVIPKLGHSWNENDICDRCGSTKPIPQYTIAKTSGASYEFVESSGIYTSNNKGKSSSTASSTLTALNDCEITITWTVSSESGYDKLTITVNGTTQVNAESGEKNDSFTVSLSAGDTIVFKYTKDGSGNTGSDCATFQISY